VKPLDKIRIKLRPLLCTQRFAEFHLSRSARERYDLSHTLFSKEGHIITADYSRVLSAAESINVKRNVRKYPQLRTTAAELYAMGLMHEIFHHVIDIYLEEHGETILQKAFERLHAKWEKEEVEQTLIHFADHFPPRQIYLGETGPEQYIRDPETGKANKESVLQELILLWITNKNPAISPYRELIDDTGLSEMTPYQEFIREIYLYMEQLPGPGGTSINLIDFLRMPAREFPGSILDQLAYIAAQWPDYLGKFSSLLLRGIDYLREEQRPTFPPGPGPTRELSFTGLEQEYEAFSKDTEWMPRVVLMAKSTLVWLDQLTRTYGRTIQQLDQIPDEELDKLANRGFNALWLIGLWERSTASKTIKRTCGNPEAEASAYSLKRYDIAEELGGWRALESLRARCEHRGIRLASDMVPNHTGIDSDWVYEHPEWFLQLPEPPYPAYTYNSQDLSGRSDISLNIEDHYYDRTDAALTFKRYDHRTGDTRYIYHGNDGTSTPWNDTAQLDFLNPDTREILIQTILHVARNFRIIRFDAAMTLARKHIHRLWYPAPGSGGDISGRSLYGISQDEFNSKMPMEFWREVVDRVAAEAPGTLLLAEAFWMMEGFFVRTLGMHRVYNSAFMNMLKNEENEKYKTTIKNTISFEPEILKRFVNFMSNPDEETAIDQFGDGDKYFGICTMMVTMPGLPMFGHGQIEGYHEKYGMEYRRAYWDESPNGNLIDEHYRRIFPLMKKRYLFADSENFRIYDLFRENDEIDHNVFVYSNRNRDERVLVAYNNAYHSVTGWIRISAPFAQKDREDRKTVSQSALAEDLGLNGDHGNFTIFREQRSGLWYIRQNSSLFERGMFLQMHGYESQVYLDFYQVRDEDGLYGRLFENLNGSGVPDIELYKKELLLQPVHKAFGRFLQGPLITPVKQALLQGGGMQKVSFDDYWSYYDDFLDECLMLGYGGRDRKNAALGRLQENLDAVSRLSQLSSPNIRPHSVDQAGYYYRGLSIIPEAPLILLSWLLFSPLDEFCRGDQRYSSGPEMAEDLLLPNLFAQPLRDLGISDDQHSHMFDLMLAVTIHSHWNIRDDSGETAGSLLFEKLIHNPFAARLLNLHWDNEVEWYHGESLQEFIWWLNTLAILDQVKNGQDISQLDGAFTLIKRWIQAEESAEYQVGRLLLNIEGP